jgi:hypothetical protein
MVCILIDYLDDVVPDEALFHGTLIIFVKDSKKKKTHLNIS